MGIQVTHAFNLLINFNKFIRNNKKIFFIIFQYLADNKELRM